MGKGGISTVGGIGGIGRNSKVSHVPGVLQPPHGKHVVAEYLNCQNSKVIWTLNVDTSRRKVKFGTISSGSCNGRGLCNPPSQASTLVACPIWKWKENASHVQFGQPRRVASRAHRVNYYSHLSQVALTGRPPGHALTLTNNSILPTAPSHTPPSFSFIYAALLTHVMFFSTL